MFHYIVSDGVVYLTLAEKGYPKKLAFQYLEELRKEFTSLYGAQIEGTTRPYAFIRFGTLSMFKFQTTVVIAIDSMCIRPCVPDPYT